MTQEHGPGPMYFVCAVCGICINAFGALFLGGHGHSHGGVPCKDHGSPLPSMMEVAGRAETSKLLHEPHVHGHAHGHRCLTRAHCLVRPGFGALMACDGSLWLLSLLAATSTVIAMDTAMGVRRAQVMGGFKKQTGTANSCSKIVTTGLGSTSTCMQCGCIRCRSPSPLPACVICGASVSCAAHPDTNIL